MASTTSTPGMIGKAGKVPGKKRLVDGDVLQRHDALGANQLGDAVDQQEWKTMGKDLQDILKVEAGLIGRGRICFSLIN